MIVRYRDKAIARTIVLIMVKEIKREEEDKWGNSMGEGGMLDFRFKNPPSGFDCPHLVYTFKPGNSQVWSQLS